MNYNIQSEKVHLNVYILKADLQEWDFIEKVKAYSEEKLEPCNVKKQKTKKTPCTCGSGFVFKVHKRDRKAREAR